MSHSYPNADELIGLNREYAEHGFEPELPSGPSRHLAVVTCMDSRVDVYQILGIGLSEAHIIRNAGGVVTDDVIRSLTLSQRYLGTREVILLHHTKCGLQGMNEEEFRADLAAECGVEPEWPLLSFEDPYDNVVRSMERLKEVGFLPHRVDIRGFVYDVDTGLIREV